MVIKLKKKSLISKILQLLKPLPPIHTYIHIVASLSVEILLLFLSLSLTLNNHHPSQSVTQDRPNTTRRDCIILLGFYFLLHRPIPVVLGANVQNSSSLSGLFISFTLHSEIIGNHHFPFLFSPNVVISVNLSSLRFIILCKHLLFDLHCCPIRVCVFG